MRSRLKSKRRTLIFRKSFLASVLALAGAVAGIAQDAPRLGPYFWPTPNKAFVQTGSLESVAQPTESGLLESASFGCVRNDGRRFHEGLDLKPIARDQRGESIDPVYAFDAGVVRYVSRRAELSSYGSYVVIEHPQIAPGFVTLYAHLRSVPESIAPGVAVRGGQKIAIMGRSAGGYRIPQERAHLHFEAGLWLGGDFQKWYDKQGFDSKNDHGTYNGMNIVGLDVWRLVEALRRGEVGDAWGFALSETAAVEAVVRSAKIPELLRVNPHLMENAILPPDLAGWRIELSWYGLPLRFTALGAGDMPAGSDFLRARALRPELLEGQLCLDMVRRGQPGTKLASLVGRLYQ